MSKRHHRHQCVWNLQTRSYDCWRIWSLTTAMEMPPRTIARTTTLSPFAWCKKSQQCSRKTKKCHLYSTGDVTPTQLDSWPAGSLVKKSITSSFFNRIISYLAVRCKKVSVNKAVKFHIKIHNVCWENGEKLQGFTFLCRTLCRLLMKCYIYLAYSIVCIALHGSVGWQVDNRLQRGSKRGEHI